MKFLKYTAVSLFLLTCISIFIFFNLGEFLDVSQKPVKSDVIVCLGGGEKYRIETSVELYNKNYSIQNILLFTGDNRSKIRKEKNMDDKRIEYIKKNNFKNINIIYEKNVQNTKEEILFIKNYLILNNYRSAMIVSDAPHIRRIKSLISLLKVNKDEKLIFNLVSSNNNWWNKKKYYLNKKAQVFALKEILKLTYSYIAYGFFDKIGLLSYIENSSSIEGIKKMISKETYFYLKNK